MLSLKDALNSGRKFRKVGSTGGFTLDAHSTFGAADIIGAATYELAPEVAKSFTLATFIAAWDASVPASGSVSKAAESAMFQRMKDRLGFTE